MHGVVFLQQKIYAALSSVVTLFTLTKIPVINISELVRYLYISNTGIHFVEIKKPTFSKVTDSRFLSASTLDQSTTSSFSHSCKSAQPVIVFMHAF